MKSFFPKDSFLKITSFVIAVILWFYVVWVVDPAVDVTVKDIHIRYANQALLESRGLSLVADPNATVELKIRGSRKKIANIDNKNIYATVDLANMTKEGTFSLPISISIPYEYNEIVDKKPYNANVMIDRVVQEKRNVEILTVGNVANGYIAGTPEASVKSVTLKGASSLVDRIKGVAATLDFDGRTGEITDKEDLYFLDSNGKVIDADDDIYGTVSMDVSTVDITCSVLKLKTVPITVDTSALGEDYKISIQPPNVTIYAENDILDGISEIVSEKIDADILAQEGVQTIKLTVPDGVAMRDGINEVTVKAEKRN